MSKPAAHYIDISQLRVGLYVHLDLGWMDHPFTFSSFRIKDETQILAIRQLGLRQLRYDPMRSDAEPLPPAKGGDSGAVHAGSRHSAAVAAAAAAEEAAVAESGDAAMPVEEGVAGMPAGVTEMSADMAETDMPVAGDEALPIADLPDEAGWRLQRAAQLQYAIDECEKQFVDATRVVRQVERGVRAQPETTVKAVHGLVDGIVDSVLSQSDIVVHALNGRRSSDDHYTHALNVAVLAMMLAKTLDMSTEDAHQLGVAAIFHDAGKDDIPKKILMQTGQLTRAEQAFLQQHCEFGARLARRIGLPERVAEVIFQHHELVDGSGYPRRLQGERIDPLARLLAVVNTYDNLCNPPNSLQSRTPYEALAYMFAHLRSKYDSMLLNLLIKSLGVYPPGSIVLLSDGSYGIVVCVNPSRPLRPYVMIHDNKPGDELPVIVDLSETPVLSISECLRRSQLPDKVLDRLNPRKRICYFVDRDLMARQQA